MVLQQKPQNVFFPLRRLQNKRTACKIAVEAPTTLNVFFFSFRCDASGSKLHREEQADTGPCVAGGISVDSLVSHVISSQAAPFEALGRN